MARGVIPLKRLLLSDALHCPDQAVVRPGLSDARFPARKVVGSSPRAMDGLKQSACKTPELSPPTSFQPPVNFALEFMSTALDLAALGLSAGVLAYQLICLQSEQRQLREALDERLASFSLPTSINDDILEPLKASIASALAEQLTKLQAPTAVSAAAPAGADTKPAATDTGLPDNLTPAQARGELRKELEEMKTDDIRARVRQLDPAKRELFRRGCPTSLDKSRKDQLITGLIEAFGL